MAAHESKTISTMMGMGLEKSSDQLIEIAKRSSDVELKKLLHLLCLIEDPSNSKDSGQKVAS
jgi:hypothetical protein